MSVRKVRHARSRVHELAAEQLSVPVADLIGWAVEPIEKCALFVLKILFLDDKPPADHPLTVLLTQQSGYQLSRDILNAVREYLGDESGEIR